MLWLITLISLWGSPVYGFLLIWYSKDNLDERKILTRVFIWSITIITAGLLTKISTASTEINWILLAIFHLSICFFIWFGFYYKNIIVKVISIILMVFVFGIGYLLSTVGILVVGFMTGGYEPSKSLRINSNTTYKEYNVGIAVSSVSGVKVCLYRNYSWFPFIERQFFSKKYIGSNGKIINENIIAPADSYVNNSPGLWSSGFKIKYDNLREEIILSAGEKRDTLHLTDRPK